MTDKQELTLPEIFRTIAFSAIITCLAFWITSLFFGPDSSESQVSEEVKKEYRAKMDDLILQGQRLSAKSFSLQGKYLDAQIRYSDLAYKAADGDTGSEETKESQRMEKYLKARMEETLKELGELDKALVKNLSDIASVIEEGGEGVFSQKTIKSAKEIRESQRAEE